MHAYINKHHHTPEVTGRVSCYINLHVVRSRCNHRFSERVFSILLFRLSQELGLFRVCTGVFQGSPPTNRCHRSGHDDDHVVAVYPRRYNIARVDRQTVGPLAEHASLGVSDQQGLRNQRLVSQPKTQRRVTSEVRESTYHLEAWCAVLDTALRRSDGCV